MAEYAAAGMRGMSVDTDAFRQGHRRLVREGVCLMCGFWPCPVNRLCDEVDRLRAALEAASAHAVEASDYADRYKAEVDRLRAVLHRRWPVVVESGRG